MADKNEIFLGILIILAFIWRFQRTRQLYHTSLNVLKSGSDPIAFHPTDARSFIDQGLLGHRTITSNSFFIRAVVFVLVALCLLPFKHYSPFLFWLVIMFITLYALWCIAHGFALRKGTAEHEEK